jgi:hypothetical protein
MSHIGEPVREGKIIRRKPDEQVVSVPERPSERAARRRKAGITPLPANWPKPGMPVRTPEPARPVKVPSGGE